MRAGRWFGAMMAGMVLSGSVTGGWARGDGGSGAGLSAGFLRCEYLVEPLAVAEERPRLSWIVESDGRAQKQTAYRVLVASSAEGLARDEGDLWDSGRVESDETVHVEYGGRALASRQRCWWKVKSWDGDGGEGAWSEPACFAMGLLAPTDWKAEWIEAGADEAEVRISSAVYHTIDRVGVPRVERDVTEAVRAGYARLGPGFVASNESLGGDPARDIRKSLHVVYVCDGEETSVEIAENARVVLPGARIPYLRREFEVDGHVARARLYVTALGTYEVRVNGARVGDAHLAPGWTDYRKRVRYQAFDVTESLARGANVIGAEVAPGWFAGHAGLFGAFRFYGESPALLAQLEIEYADGRTQHVVTNERWVRHAGPLGMADILKGETHDARREIAGWDAPGFDDSAWSPVAVREESRTLQPQISEPIRVVEELVTIAVTEPAPGRWTFDLGQNMVGVVRLRVEQARGTRLTIRHGEMLNPDGTLYTANLRAADSTDRYVCAGRDGGETWQPRFTFHGFRYVEITGLAGKPDAGTVTGVVLSSDMPEAGAFECSDERVNQLQRNIVWGMRGNYLDIPTDCPQRDERMGWMADAQVFLPTAAMNADVGGFMTKWMVDVIDAQRDDGAHSDVAPAMKGLNYGTPAWGDAGVIVPWAIYEAYGDRRMLERSIDSMAAWVAWCERNSTGLIRDKARGNDYGDWLSIEADTPKDLIGTAYFAHAADIVSRALRVLGRDDEAARHERLFDDIRRAFNAEYVASDGTIHGRTQSGYVIALAFDLLDQPMRERAAGHLVSDIEARGWRLSTGFVGVSHLLHALTSVGRDDVAYRLLLQDEFPSWLFSVKHGATTIWERWNGWTPETGPHPDISMNSFNHYSLGSCGRWMFERLAGIAAEPGAPGYRRVVIAPAIREGERAGITWARATFRSIRGEFASAWRVEDGTVTLEVRVPANTVATVRVPLGPGGADDVRESGESLARASGVRVLGIEGDEVVMEVGSGSYVFTAE